MSTDLAQLACDRYEIADALHRYAFGLDHGDPDTLASAFTEEAVFDFRPAGAKVGIKFPVLSGRDAILANVLPLIGPLDTSHTASNLQIEISGDSATLTAFVMSQHFMPRQGSRRGSERPRFRDTQKAAMVTGYGEPEFGGESRSCFRGGKQAQHRVGDRESLGRGGSAVDF